MARSDLLLGIDVGTTGCKALLIDAEGGGPVADATRGHRLDTPRPLWAEQDPECWWEGACAVIRQVLARAGAEPRRVAAVGLTGQMHGLVLLDSAGDVLRPAILWNDQRTAAQCAEITRRVGKARVLQLTGNPVLTGFTAPKIAWVRKHEPAVYERAAHVLLPKDYVRYKLTDQLAADVSDASGTSLFEVGRRRWSDEMLAALDLPRAWLPHVFESAEIAGRITGPAALRCGLLPGTPVVAGAGDQAAQAIGGGILREGDVAVTLGTSGVVFAACDSYRAEPSGRLHAFCHAAPGAWHVMGVMLSAGGSLRWFRDALGAEERARAASERRDVYDVLLAPAADVPAGCEGLLFLPYLTGERTPHADPAARGVFFGLTLRHGKGHMARAVLEGVAYGLRDGLELVRGLGIDARQIRLSGGGAASPLWRQMLADVFNRPLALPEINQGAAYGAALLAGVGAGAFRDAAEAAERCVHVAQSVSPGALVAEYERGYERFRALYPALAPHFARIATPP
ncbi:MAG TPA: xylulokinase [Phycisphaerae bacterium]|nr:xylulokinase [Phycisphaerae bacterium]